ncbi:hypothetical protein ASNO1_03100 [Corallococcus caeni]|uniref:Uncharacterized protein n=2 Tax=Corallococcus caeni TaxID=3082388 RepID=A0ABQ6QJ36_9BACT|nr:hypothetical protein ASNO1_03100 [Corallococcus sp. NO1]
MTVHPCALDAWLLRGAAARDSQSRAALPEASVGPDGTLRMKTTIAEVPAEVALGFLDNRLAAVDVFFQDVADLRTLHAVMRDLLTRKYGEPRTRLEVARELKWQKLPMRFAADLTPVEDAAAAVTVQTMEGALSSQGRPKLISRWTTLESHVNLTQWSRLSRGVVAIQYESAKCAPRRADLAGRYSTKALQELVKDL